MCIRLMQENWMKSYFQLGPTNKRRGKTSLTNINGISSIKVILVSLKKCNVNQP